MVSNKEAKLAYKQEPRPMGIFSIRNLVNGKVFIGSSVDLPAIFNRIRFQLNAEVHTNKELEADWKQFGPDNFEFEILEQLTTQEQSDNYSTDLEVLEDLWIEKRQPFGENGYNVKKKTREERLRMIAANRKL